MCCTLLDTNEQVVQQAVSMMEKGALSRTTHFRYAYIHATEAGSQHIAQPCALARLAMLLVRVRATLPLSILLLLLRCKVHVVDT
jgi:hypothetical protein